jgi:hypothetical protein
VGSRLPIFQSAFHMLRDMPFTGVGLNNFFIVDTLYSPEVIPPYSSTPHAHDLFLQVALDGGVVGLVAFLAVFVTFFYLIIRSIKFIPISDLRAIFIGLASSGIVFLVYGLAETNTLGHKTSLLMWVMLGMAGGLFKGTSQVFPARFLKPFRWGIAFCALAIGIFAWPVLLGTAYSNAAFFEMHRAVLAGPAVDKEKLNLAEKLAKKALAFSPTSGRVHLVLAEAALYRDDMDLAAQEYAQTTAFDPADRYARYRLGERLFWLGKIDLAVEQWKLANAPVALLIDGAKLEKEKQYKEAAVWLQAAVMAEPDFVRLQTLLERVLTKVK